MLKLNIPNSEDWKTDTNNNMINCFRELMFENNEYQDDALVGIFWYDPAKDDLFGVYAVDVNDVNFYKSDTFNCEVKTCKQLHYAIWQKECNKGRDKRFQTMDYTKYPRGRVFQLSDGSFIVCVGKWIRDYPSCKDLILIEFQLPKDNTEFVIDSHWDLGHGWSDKKL